MRSIRSIITPAAALCLGAGLGLADSITPGSFSATINVGDSVTVHKTVTVNLGPATSSKVDVYFLADTTGSMGGSIDAVKAAANEILTGTVGIGDVAWAVGDYQDFPTDPWGGVGDHPYELKQSMTTVPALAQNGINNWNLGWGNDGPESQLAALEALSKVAGGTTGWRDGSERMVVWFGDWPGHDSAAEPTYPGPTEAAATAALQAANCQVLAVDVGILDAYGQATRITAATGGTLYTGINPASIVDTIKNAINTAVSTYTTVGIDLSEVPAGLSATVLPINHVGSYDRSIDRSFEFDVSFAGDAAGSYDFNVYGTVDGGRVAAEQDHIVVRDTSTPTPDGGTTALLLGLAVLGMGVARRNLA